MNENKPKEFCDKELSAAELKQAIHEEIRTSSNVSSPETKQIFYGLLNLVSKQQLQIDSLKQEVMTVKKHTCSDATSKADSDYSILSEITFT